jgi:hypothetical protein
MGTRAVAVSLCFTDLDTGAEICYAEGCSLPPLTALGGLLLILTQEELTALKSRTPYPLSLDSVTLQRIMGKLRITCFFKNGSYKVYEV